MLGKISEVSDVSEEKKKEELKQKIRHLREVIVEEGLSILLGAGASKTAGLPTMIELTKVLEDELSSSKKNNNEDLYKFLGECISILKSEHPEGITVEQILEMIYHLHFLTKERESKLSFSLGEFKNIDTQLLISSINFIKKIIWEKCHHIDEEKLKTHLDFLQSFIGTSARIRKLDIFTTNWDFAIEMACDNLRYKCVDGFVGMFNAFENFGVFDEVPSKQPRTIYLYKLHGSLNWFLEDEKLRKKTNWRENESSISQRFMVFPTPSKFKEILGYPYADLISRFSDALLKRTHPLLLVIGYSLIDTHITTKISSMLQNNDRSNLFIIDPHLSQGQISERLGIDASEDGRVTLLQINFEEFTSLLKELSKSE